MDACTLPRNQRKSLRRFAWLAATASPLLLLGQGSTADDRATSRFQHSGRMPVEETAVTQADFFSEAPTGFDNRTNGFLRQGPPFDSLDEDNVEPNRSFNDNRFIFEEVEVLADGLGPTYNAQSCSDSDFLSHDIGTGDGIPVLPGPEYAITRNLIRTAPLWALRTRNRLMHDGLSFTKQEAIQRHGNQAAACAIVTTR